MRTAELGFAACLGLLSQRTSGFPLLVSEEMEQPEQCEGRGRHRFGDPPASCVVIAKAYPRHIPRLVPRVSQAYPNCKGTGRAIAV